MNKTVWTAFMLLAGRLMTAACVRMTADSFLCMTADSFLCALYRLFGRVSVQHLEKVLSLLCANVDELVISLNGLVESGPRLQDPTVLQHRNSMQQHVFFLSWFAQMSEAQSSRDTADQRRADAEQGGLHGFA